MLDPTREEMLKLLEASPEGQYSDEFEREAAIYWFSSDWHGGQWSNLYSACSTSPYKPSILAKGIESEEGLAGELYQLLESTYCQQS